LKVSRFIFVLPSLSLILSACASGPNYQLPPGVSETQFKRDLSTCTEESGLLRYAGERNTLIEQCMSQLGYQLSP
jgi:hypothetical protein